MAITGYSTFPKAPQLEPHHQIALCHIQDSRQVEYYTSAKMQWMKFLTPADWVTPTKGLIESLLFFFKNIFGINDPLRLIYHWTNKGKLTKKQIWFSWLLTEYVGWIKNVNISMRIPLSHDFKVSSSWLPLSVYLNIHPMVYVISSLLS